MTRDQEDRLLHVLLKIEGWLNAPAQEYLSIKQAAEYIGISERQVRHWVSKAQLPASNAGGNDRPTYRIARADLIRFMDQRRVGPALGHRLLPG